MQFLICNEILASVVGAKIKLDYGVLELHKFVLIWINVMFN